LGCHATLIPTKTCLEREKREICVDKSSLEPTKITVYCLISAGHSAGLFFIIFRRKMAKSATYSSKNATLASSKLCDNSAELPSFSWFSQSQNKFV